MPGTRRCVTPLAAAGDQPPRLPAGPVAIVGRHRERDSGFPSVTAVVFYGPGDAVVGQAQSCTRNYLYASAIRSANSRSLPRKWVTRNWGISSHPDPAIGWIICADCRTVAGPALVLTLLPRRDLPAAAEEDAAERELAAVS